MHHIVKTRVNSNCKSLDPQKIPTKWSKSFAISTIVTVLDFCRFPMVFSSQIWTTHDLAMVFYIFPLFSMFFPWFSVFVPWFYLFFPWFSVFFLWFYLFFPRFSYGFLQSFPPGPASQRGLPRAGSCSRCRRESGSGTPRPDDCHTHISSL